MPLKPLTWYKKLSSKKGRLEAGAFLVEGFKATQQIMDMHSESILEIVATEEPPACYRDYPIRLVTESGFRSMCFTKTPQGILAVVQMPADTYSEILPASMGNRILLLEDIQDPGNVGTLMRTAAAFDYSGIILSEKCADPFSSKAVQSTAGTVLSVWIRKTNRYHQLAKELKERGYSTVAADLKGLNDPSLLSGKHKLLLMLGNEASGLSQSMLTVADNHVKIPIDREKAESLNVAVCGAICMYLSSRHGYAQ